MATAMTFASLQDDVRKYLERGSVADADVYAQIPSLINLAERQIASELKVQGFIDVLSFNLVAGQSVILVVDSYDGDVGPFTLNISAL